MVYLVQTHKASRGFAWIFIVDHNFRSTLSPFKSNRMIFGYILSVLQVSSLSRLFNELYLRWVMACVTVLTSTS